MVAKSAQYAALHDGSSRSSEDTLSLTEIEKQGLVEGLPSEALPRSREGRIYVREKISWIISIILAATNLVFLALFVCQKQEAVIEPRKSWLPPEIPQTSLFKFQTIFGAGLNNASEKAWNDLMPVGRGFVIIKNDTALPDQPGLDQSLSEQKAMVSVFHQLHCLYMTREGYYSALAGNHTQVSSAHLTHCFDYLRQTIMCFGDTTLEWLPAPPNDIGSTGWGFEHKCRDFRAISDWVEDNRLKTTHGIH